MGVPAADVCKRDFKADIRFDQSRDLAHTLAEFTVWIARAVRRHIGLLLDRLHELHGFECLAASVLERGVRSRAVHGLERIRAEGVVHLEFVDGVYGYGII